MKRVLPILILLLLISGVFALPVDLTIIPQEQRITFNEKATFNVTIHNSGADAIKLRLFSPNFPDWDFASEPLMNPILLNLAPQQSQIVSVAFTPLHVNAIGVYNLPVHIQNIDSKEYQTEKFRISLLSLDRSRADYIPSVKMTTDSQILVDPRETESLHLTIENLNVLSLSELTIQVRSTLFSADVSTTLAPRGEKEATRTIQVPIDLADNTPPQEDTLLITLLYHDKKIGDILVVPISVTPFTSIESETQLDEKFLRIRKVVTYTNKGNVRFEGEQHVAVTLFEQLFSSTDPKASKDNTQGRSYVFFVYLNPGESQTVYVFVNYYPIAIVVLLLVAGLILYYLYRSPLILTKQAVDVTYADGGISGLRVNIRLRNRSSVPIKDIVITDKAPRLTVVEPGVSLGSLPPSSTKRFLDGGTQLTWHIDDLGAEEERMITYRMKTPLSVVGEYTLNPALAHFSTAGRKGTIKSGFVRVGSQ